MRFSRWSQQGTETLKVDMTRTGPEQIPYVVEFAFPGECFIRIDLASFQTLRRAVPITDNGTEHKIMLIKHLRGLSNLSLKQSKDVVEWFLANVDRDI